MLVMCRWYPGIFVLFLGTKIALQEKNSDVQGNYMKKITLVLLLIAIVSLIIAYPVRITSWNITEDVKKLNSMHISVDYVNRDTQTIIVYVPNDSDFQRLLSNGFNAEIMPDLAKINAKEDEKLLNSKDGPLRAYYTLDAYHTFLESMVTQYPNLCQLVQFGTSVQDRPLYFLKISDNVSQEENEPEFRFVSSMHGDEVVGYENCIRLIQLLTSQYTTNTRISNIVDNTEIWICPMLNPDGYVAQERYNGNGADINRNFALPIGNQHPDGMAWQPETIAIMNHGNAHSINLSANFHGGALVTNYAWDYIYALAPDNNLLIQLAHAYADYNLPMHNSSEFTNGITNGAQWYIAEGTLQDWVYANNDCIDLTIELSNTKWPPSNQLDTYWSQNQESMLTYLEFVQKGVHGTVTSSTGVPLSATISLNSAGIDIKTDPQVGDFHRMLLPGTYTITASAEGYTTVSESVIVPATGSVTHNFVLPNVVLTSFAGFVTSLQGVPISNAQVKLVADISEFQILTDAQGHFSFTDIPAGDYTLSVSAAGYGLFTSVYHLDQENNKQVVVLPNPIFSDDFENGLANWTVQSPWGIATQSTNHVFSDSPTGSYANNILLNATLTNPVSLTDVTSPVLSFDTKYVLESGYDYVNVQASSNGSNWANLVQLTGSQTVWHTLTFPLSAYIGSNVYLRFQIDSDFGQTADGIYIDNVSISGMSSQVTVYGDIDSNWLLNLTDAANVLEYSVGNDPIPLIDPIPWVSTRLEAADVDNDNQITATDAYYVYDKCNQYNGAFPAQGGTADTFQNPNLSFVSINSELRIMAENPAYLKSLSLSFSSATSLSIQSVNWQITNDESFLASSYDKRNIGLVIKQNATCPAYIAGLPYLTLDNIIHCTGLVNDIPVNLDINMTPNEDPQYVVLVTNLESNYPNPFNPETTIRFTLAKNDTPAKLVIYNAKGQEVKTLITGLNKTGAHSINWNGTDNQSHSMANGIYYYRLQTPDKTITRKMVMLK